ncbi:MAG: Fis family transcriptional regulator [Rhodocyclales bacterium]|nr:Fis family transcriptional regulator [Rhodocyclales bacterium]
MIQNLQSRPPAENGPAPSPAPHARVLTLPGASDQALSIRAKALVFNDPKSVALYQHVGLIASSEANVLIIGETGTGKELIARHVHSESGRRGPFLAVNCGAFNENLVEAELFGHEAGAFTGAQQTRAGWFEAANGGTLFLDEVGDLPLSMQVKLLRVLQERQVVRLGSRKPIAIDIRLVAGTNVDLERAVTAGHFRRDLFYRLNVAPVQLPPLRERRGDILPLVEYFIEFYRHKLHIATPRLSTEAERQLYHYEWPGNIRELENVVHFALIVCQDNVIQANDLRLANLQRQTGTPVAPANTETSNEASLSALRFQILRLLDAGLPDLHEHIERIVFTTAFEYSRNNQAHTAKELGITRNVLRTHLKRLGLIRETTDDRSPRRP